MIELAKDIGLSDELINKLKTLNSTDIQMLCERCKADFKVLKKQDELTRLAVCLSYAKRYTLPRYIEKEISHDIFIDTMSDIKIWYINKGLKNYDWIENHLNFKLFKIGRLQYQLYKCENKTLNYDFLPFNFGDNLLYVHIPEGEKLIYEDCYYSLREAKRFFTEYFAEFEYRYYFCESWLLYRENQLFMRPDSNIMQFQLFFDIVYSVPDDKQAIERIFKKRELSKSRYPENTSLQISAKEFMLRGGKLGMGIGIIDKADL